MKIVGKIALILTGGFLVFALLGGVVLSVNGGIQASFQQVYQRLEEVWPYELFDRAEESLDQIQQQIGSPSSRPSNHGDSPSENNSGSSSSQTPVSGEDSYQIPIAGLREIDIKAQDCTVEITPGEAGSQISVILDRKGDKKLQLEVYQEEEELKIRATKRGLLPSSKQAAVLKISIPSDYRGDFSFDGEACTATLREINFGGEIDLELSACDFQGNGLRGTELSISASTATVALSEVKAKVELEQSLGDTSLAFEEVAGDIEIENSLGNIDLYFPANSPIQINSASSLGEINRNLQHSGSGQASGPLYQVEITSSMGSVNLYDAE